MSDYIERQKAIEACENTPANSIDAEKGLLILNGLGRACDVIKAIPAADVVPVVRCRKCKYFWTYQCMDSMPIETCELAQTFYNPDLDFCSLAKRREE